MKVIYLDNNATTKVAEEVLEEMLPYFSRYYGNPSSMHLFGGQVDKKINQARERVAELINANPTEIVFTSCGTESDNAAIRGILEASPERKQIVTTKVEHPAVLNVCKYLEKKGYFVTYIPVNREGLLDLSEVENAITTNTAIVSIMYANNETGVIFPVEEIGAIAKEKGAVFHVDGVQAVGKIPINMKKSNIDLLSISGHKLHAPKGVGVLYCKKGIRIRPFMMGGHQERGRRGGTENVASIIGLGKASEIAGKYIEEENNRVRALRDRLENSLLGTISSSIVNGSRIYRLPNTTSISFEFVEGEAILLLLSEAGICASSGSACTSGSLEPSHVLRAMGIPFTHAHGSIRFSLSSYTTDKEIDYTIAKVPDIISKLRNISPYGKKSELKVKQAGQ